MPTDLAELEAFLADVPTERRPPPRWRRRLARLLAWAVAVPAALALPFVVLIRTATEAYDAGGGTWPAVALGALATLLLLVLYVAVLGYRLRGTARVSRRVWQGLAVLVAAYCLYGLVYLSGANAKTDAVHAEYTALHPVLRMAVGTLVLVDSDVLVTDAAREPADYMRMGLTPAEASLHYRQRDRYVHAVDLRTAGRSGLRNVATTAYFRLLGFRTLRHVGTADHLHVSLPMAVNGDP